MPFRFNALAVRSESLRLARRLQLENVIVDFLIDLDARIFRQPIIALRLKKMLLP